MSGFFFAPLLNAQFTITENFKGSSVASNIVLGGDPSAILTSGIADPINEGWLRLTNDNTFQRGYAYIDTPFPSTLGVYIEFEYKTWRTKEDSHNGADGFSVFLFDANTSFRVGADGGSLSYSQRDGTPGLAGAYLGIGFDEYGNFAMSSESKNGGTDNLAPHSIVLRGTEANNYPYLTSEQLQTSPSTDGPTAIDYNDHTISSRPGDSQFFRRVKIYIEPIGTTENSKYRIRVLWRISPTGDDIPLIS